MMTLVQRGPSCKVRRDSRTKGQSCLGFRVLGPRTKDSRTKGQSCLGFRVLGPRTKDSRTKAQSWCKGDKAARLVVQRVALRAGTDGAVK